MSREEVLLRYDDPRASPEQGRAIRAAAAAVTGVASPSATATEHLRFDVQRIE